jgi:hypothetical protein
LEAGEPEELRDLVTTVLASPYRGLGIFLARSLLPLAEEKNVSALYEGIIDARAKLNLSPDDDFDDFVQDREVRRRQGRERAEIREMEDRYQAKAEEARRLNEEKRKAERELALREKRARDEAVASVIAIPSDTEAINALRTKVKTLEVQLRENAAGQVAARREREKTEEDNRRLRAAAAAEAAKDDAEEEDYKVEGNQPLRLFGFPKNFRETLAKYPKHVGRATMIRLGRLASGEPGAFTGMKPIHAYPGMMEVRISDSHRLLFCLESESVRVVDLILRCDLNERLDRLKASGLPPVG